MFVSLKTLPVPFLRINNFLLLKLTWYLIPRSSSHVGQKQEAEKWSSQFLGSVESFETLPSHQPCIFIINQINREKDEL